MQAVWGAVYEDCGAKDEGTLTPCPSTMVCLTTSHRDRAHIAFHKVVSSQKHSSEERLAPMIVTDMCPCTSHTLYRGSACVTHVYRGRAGVFANIERSSARGSLPA